MLAYSSIENMGIIAFGVGIGGLATYGAMLHLIHHSLIKSSLFLSSGNILLGYGSKLVNKTGNMAKMLPKTFTSFFCRLCRYFRLPTLWYFCQRVVDNFGSFSAGEIYQHQCFYLCPYTYLCRGIATGNEYVFW